MKAGETQAQQQRANSGHHQPPAKTKQVEISNLHGLLSDAASIAFVVGDFAEFYLRQSQNISTTCHDAVRSPFRLSMFRTAQPIIDDSNRQPTWGGHSCAFCAL